MHLYFEINCLLAIEIYFILNLATELEDRSLFLIFYFKINYPIATKIATEHALIYFAVKINYSIATKIAIEYYWLLFYI